MAASARILESHMVFEVEAGERIERGELVYFATGTSDWRLSDADSGSSPAEYIALTSADDTERLKVAKEAVLYDPDSNSYHTAGGSALYLSETPGAVTVTRNTDANGLKQRVGTTMERMGGTGAQFAHIRINEPQELTIHVALQAATVAAVTQSNDFGGDSLSADGVNVFGNFMVPENALTDGLVIAYLWWTCTTALDASDTYTFDAAAGVDDEVTTTHADGITAAALTVDVNDLNRADVTAGLNGTGLIDPGNCVGINIEKAAEGAGGDDPIILTLAVVLTVV